MKIDILMSDPRHPVYPFLSEWADARRISGDDVRLLTEAEACEAGRDLLFLISYGRILGADILGRYRTCLVIHASDVPKGRGMSPLAWQVLEGRAEIVVSLLEADPRVDAGAVWAKRVMAVAPTDLWDDLCATLFATELELMTLAVEGFGRTTPVPQDSTIAPTYYRRRRPEDSRLDPERSIADQFDLIRICDPDRFPAFFEWRGCTYTLKIEKA